MPLDLLVVEWVFVVESFKSVECVPRWSTGRRLLLRASLGKVLRSGPSPYPRYITPSLAPEWIEASSEEGVDVVSD